MLRVEIWFHGKSYIGRAPDKVIDIPDGCELSIDTVNEHVTRAEFALQVFDERDIYQVETIDNFQKIWIGDESKRTVL